MTFVGGTCPVFDIWGEIAHPRSCRQIYDHRFWNAWVFGLEGPWNFLFETSAFCVGHTGSCGFCYPLQFFSRSSGFPKVHIDSSEQITFFLGILLVVKFWHNVCTEARCVMVFGHSYVTVAVSHTSVVLSKFQSVLKATGEFPKRKNLPSWTFLGFHQHAVAFCKCPRHFSRILLKI